MLVAYHLPRFSSGSCESHSEYHAVKSPLQHDHQVLTRHSLHSVCLFIIVPERPLQNAVDELRLLLLPKLQSILAYFLACPHILSLGLLIISQIGGFQTQCSASFQYGYTIYCHFLISSSLSFCLQRLLDAFLQTPEQPLRTPQPQKNFRQPCSKQH